MKKNKNQLTNYLRNILSSVVGEYHSHLYTEYNLINEDTEKRIDEHVELSHKPSSGDVIHCTDSIYQSEHGCEAIEVTLDKGITLRELQDLKEGIHNTMSVGVDNETGRLYISIW